MADEAVAVDVNLPRYLSELRSMRCEQSLLNKTDGSASFLQGDVSYLFEYAFFLGENIRHEVARTCKPRTFAEKKS